MHRLRHHQPRLGRPDHRAGWTYAYDAQGRLLVATETASGDRLEMACDATGHRTQLREVTAGVPTRTRDLRYAGDAIVEETVTDAAHPSGAVVRTYTATESGQVVSMTIPAGEPSAGTYLPTWNGHGDALALWRQNADGTLTLANTVTYGTWGTPVIATHNGIGDLGFRFLYVGAADVEWDDFSGAGLLYMHARHYHPSLGRFLQPDPSAADANLYGYAGDNPVTRVDPSGRIAIIVPIGVCLATPGCILAVGAGLWAVWNMVVWGVRNVHVTLNFNKREQLVRNSLTGKAFERASIRDLRRDWPAVKAPTHFRTRFGSRFLDACVFDSHKPRPVMSPDLVSQRVRP